MVDAKRGGKPAFMRIAHAVQRGGDAPPIRDHTKLRAGPGMLRCAPEASAQPLNINEIC